MLAVNTTKSYHWETCRNEREKWKGSSICARAGALQFSLTTSKKKSTWGRLWTKNRTGCRSMVTFTVKSCGVPGFTVFLGIASWWEWINVSSKSNTSVLRCTMPSRWRDTGVNGNRSYLTGWYWTNWIYYFWFIKKHFIGTCKRKRIGTDTQNEKCYVDSIHTALTCRLNMKHRHVHTFDASTTNALKFIWNCDNIGISCTDNPGPMEKCLKRQLLQTRAEANVFCVLFFFFLLSSRESKWHYRRMSCTASGCVWRRLCHPVDDRCEIVDEIRRAADASRKCTIFIHFLLLIFQFFSTAQLSTAQHRVVGT